MALKSFLSTAGISHLTSPHTPEHNGVSERKHRHIVGTRLSLLSHAGMPRSYWTYAFSAAVYLISRLPTPVLNMTSPFSKLFGTRPHYDKLKIFGCLCFLWLRPYTTHKLDNRSTPCVFLGHSTTQSAYLYLQKDSGRIYISRHVQFDEQVFPFLQSSPLQATSEAQSTEKNAPLHSFVPLKPPLVASPLPTLGNPEIAPSPPVTSENSIDGLVGSDTQTCMISNSISPILAPQNHPDPTFRTQHQTSPNTQAQIHKPKQEIFPPKTRKPQPPRHKHKAHIQTFLTQHQIKPIKPRHLPLFLTNQNR